MSVGEKGADDAIESIEERAAVVFRGEKEFWQDISKLLNVNVSTLIESHRGHFHWTFERPRRIYSCDVMPQQSEWNQMSQESQQMPPWPSHVLACSHIPQGYILLGPGLFSTSPESSRRKEKRAEFLPWNLERRAVVGRRS